MGRRRVFALTTAAAVLGLACARALPGERVETSIGRQVPEFLAAEPGTVTVAWAFEADDMLSCSSAAMALRHTAARFGPRVRLVALPIGDDWGLVDSFMRRQRLNPEIRRLSKWQLSRQLGTSRLPAVFIIRGHHVRESFSDTTWSDGVHREERPLETVVAMLLSEPRAHAD